MKKNGFTLVEILAVLVLIAAIAIISVPSIINYINQSKNEISAVTEQLIFTGVDLYVENNKNLFPEKSGNQYCVTLNDVVESGVLDKPIIDSVSDEEIDLNKFVKISYLYDENLKINKYNYEIVDSCTQVTKICRPAKTDGNDAVTTGNVPSGNYAYGDEYICDPGDGVERRFYVLEDGDNTTLTKGTTGSAGPGEISLIMDRNFTDTDEVVPRKLAWCIDVGRDNTCKNINSKEEGTPLKHIQDAFGNNVEVSFPTKDQVTSANNGSTTNLPQWLYDHLDETTHPESEVYGYWTASPYAGIADTAWYVSYFGYVDGDGVDGPRGCGVRPVITISKDNFID